MKRLQQEKLKEIAKAAIELDASVQPLMTSAQLFMSGVEYSFNQNRMIFNKVEKDFMDTV